MSTATDYLAHTITTKAGALDRALDHLIREATRAREDLRTGSPLNESAVAANTYQDVATQAAALRAVLDAARVVGLATDDAMAALDAAFDHPVRR